MVGNSDGETNFPHEFLLTNRQVANLRKAFGNYLSPDVKLLKIQSSKMVQSGELLGRLLGPLLKTGLQLMKNIIKPLAKIVLIPLWLTAAAADARIYKNILQCGNTTLIISNDEMEHIITISKSLEDCCLLLKEVSETIQAEFKEQKGRFLSMLLGTLGASLLGNTLAGKGMNRAEEGIVRAG